MQNTGYANMSRMGSQFGESHDARLTQHNLDSSIHEDHVFDVIGEMHVDDKLLAGGADPEGFKDAVKTPGGKHDDGQEDSQEEPEGENSDGEDFMVFFDKDEIESTKQWQEENFFDELVQTRLQAVDFSITANKIDIMKYAPKIEDIAKNPGGKAKKAKGRTKSMKSSQTGDLGEDQILNEVEADEIIAEQQKKVQEEALKKQ